MSKKGLGRGLGALIPTGNDVEITQEGREQISELDINLIVPNDRQPRRQFDEEKLEELAASIREHGVVQPVVVRSIPGGKYELVVGERRWRACRRLGFDKIPAVVKELNDGQVAEMALIENLQRQDLNPMEEAEALSHLMEEFGLTQERLSQRIGKSRSYIANALRLLNLPKEIQEFVALGVLSTGHAKVILGLDNPAMQIQVAQKVIKNNLSVRRTEELVRAINQEKEGKEKAEAEVEERERLDPLFQDIEDRLKIHFKTQVKIKTQGNRGKIEIEYYSDEDLQRILDVFLLEDGY